jgi:hypothetical protein
MSTASSQREPGTGGPTGQSGGKRKRGLGLGKACPCTQLWREGGQTVSSLHLLRPQSRSWMVERGSEIQFWDMGRTCPRERCWPHRPCKFQHGWNPVEAERSGSWTQRPEAVGFILSSKPGHLGIAHGHRKEWEPLPCTVTALPVLFCLPCGSQQGRWWPPLFPTPPPQLQGTE